MWNSQRSGTAQGAKIRGCTIVLKGHDNWQNYRKFCCFLPNNRGCTCTSGTPLVPLTLVITYFFASDNKLTFTYFLFLYQSEIATLAIFDLASRFIYGFLVQAFMSIFLANKVTNVMVASIDLPFFFPFFFPSSRKFCFENNLGCLLILRI